MTTQDRATINGIAGEIAAQLGETESSVRRQIGRALRILGDESPYAFLAQALAVEAAGGMMLPDGRRRHTVGGLFFRLMREQLMGDEASRQDAYRIFRPHGTKGRDAQKASTDKAPRTTASYDWTAFSADATEAMSEPGKATTVKLTVIGKPGKVVARDDIVFVGLTSPTVPSLPKGVPAPAGGGRFLAIISGKQWAKVAAALAADPNDKVIAEGYPSIQDGFKGISVSVTSVTTTGIQAGKRVAQQAQ